LNFISGGSNQSQAVGGNQSEGASSG